MTGAGLCRQHRALAERPGATVDEASEEQTAGARESEMVSRRRRPFAVTPSPAVSQAMNERIQRELQGRIEAFATDLTEILRRTVADSVAEVLGGVRRPRSAAPAPRGRKIEAARAARAEALFREVTRKGDRRIEQIAKSMRISTKELKAPMGRLLKAKRVKRTGAARGTRYRAA